MKKKNKNLVTYIVTLYNKKKYLASVINALAIEGGAHRREYIFIDDGSRDSTKLILKILICKLPGEVKIISRKNMGASFSTNEAIRKAKGYWLRLLDGDDTVSFKSTYKMLSIARMTKEEFIYGCIYEDQYIPEKVNLSKYKIQSRNEGLKKFIRNCPANSSCILVSKKRYEKAGGCDNAFVSPDQVLFLRLFNSGKGVFFKEIVARMPKIQSDVRLSSQTRRSRYESILALIRFCEDNKDVDLQIKKLAFKRALSRANNYNKFLNKKFFSIFLIMYFFSKFYFPKNYISWMYKSLIVFTNNDIKKPISWLTGFEKKIISKKQINQY